MRTVTADQIPPYGYMWDAFQRVATERAQPPDWIDRKGLPSWESWLRTSTALIRDSIWPEYVVGKGWRGAAKANAVRLTRVELDLMARFRKAMLRRRASAVDPGAFTHAELFDVEDLETWEKTLPKYCPELGGLASDMQRAVEDTWYQKVAYVAQDLKAVFQRPRAYQMAMIMARPGAKAFGLGWAKSSLTPSLVSGHALQAAMVGCNVYSRIRGYDPQLATRCQQRLQAWAMTIGDRRVMAGVHYPTDNIASWIVCLRLVERVFPDPGLRPFLVEAIRRHSPLFAFLESRQKGSAAVAQALKPAWTELLRSLNAPSGRSVRAPTRQARIGSRG